MRTIIIGLFLLFYAIISIPLYFVEFIIGKKEPRAKVTSSQKIVVLAFRIILWIAGVKKTVIGIDNIPKNEAVLYVSNHRSYFDILIAYTTVPNLTGFVAKKEMEHIPCISRWMRYLNCLFLDRTNLREGMKTILQGIEQIKNGYSVFISPEGTRNHNKEMLPFHEGSFKMAEKSGCPIIPVAISNTDAIFENHFPWVKKAHVIIEYGKPIYIKKLPKENQKFIGVYVQNIIKDMLLQNNSKI